MGLKGCVQPLGGWGSLCSHSAPRAACSRWADGGRWGVTRDGSGGPRLEGPRKAEPVTVSGLLQDDPAGQREAEEMSWLMQR